MTTKQLRPLLRMLREHGVTEYRDGGFALRLAPVVAVREVPRPDSFDPEVVADDQGESQHPEEEEDPAFFLERIHAANRPESERTARRRGRAA